MMRVRAAIGLAVLLGGTVPSSLRADASTKYSFDDLGRLASVATELGLYLTPSGRLYDPETGRFIQQDSHLGRLSDPPSLHRYLYGHGNPARFIDPTGHSDEDAN